MNQRGRSVLAMNVVLGAVVIALGVAREAVGSDCVRKDPVAAARDAQIAFIARVKTADPSDFERVPGRCDTSLYHRECGARLNTMEVRRVLRGDVPSFRVRVITEDTCRCNGPFFALGREYLVVAEPNTSASPGDYVAKSKCDGTVELGYSSDAEVLRAWEGKK